MTHYHVLIRAATGRAWFEYGGGFGSRSSAREYGRRDAKQRPFAVRSCDDARCKLRDKAKRRKKRHLRVVA